jgi:ketosteroid isomerase-like protein
MSEPIDRPSHELQSVLIGPADPDIVTLEARLRAAQLSADVSALDTLIAENLLFTGPDGQLASKADDLAMHRSRAVRIRAHEPEELRIRRVGADVAVVALRARLTVEAHGALVMQGPVRYTRMWAREVDGVWRVVAGHVSAIPG